ncbi:putative leucine-rich repeat domain, L domain-containing protein [Rosa chinensis]|uniref:Putative leucine-rich repeat domain, L domain-containing protein n=2 Tax=Rosa chinensis TaxID=74649 RepID=A0A2P6Q642_ROSCH|nr:putative leucine-rich repeat domain, L domain-containing protein [Rosa chinensis]
MPLWHTIDTGVELSGYHEDWKDVEKMCRNAIDRSSGQLVDISCVYGSNDLLKYVGDRCNGIRRLTLHWCSGIIDGVLNEVAYKFPLLEEIHLFKLDRCSLSPKTLEMIGRSCPILKSFKWYKIICKSTVRGGQDDDYAKAIAGTMRGLQHLSLSRLNLTNNAMKEILDYCPYLESLDLGYVFRGRFWIRKRRFRNKNEGKKSKFVAALSSDGLGVY